ncbi:MAG: GyrI-like domain-containing protein [Chloroflexota bacterium]
MEKIDLKKTYKTLYTAKPQPAFVDVPPLGYLMIDGEGDPNKAAEYQESLQALYGVAYTLKFQAKKSLGRDFGVMGLEGLWWAEDMAGFSMERKDDWLWTMMMLQPDFVTPELAAAAKDEARRKKGQAAIEQVRFEVYEEGLSAQVMHLGPYDAEPPTIARLHEFIHANGCELRGKHHEIYFGDPRRTAPEKLKTIIRQPVERV